MGRLCGRMKVPRFLGPNVYPEAPDGGWGWVVAGAFFLVAAFTYGIIKTFGIFLQDLKLEFEESNSRLSWIVSICLFVMTFNAPLSSVLTNRFGFQLVVMTGGFLISAGTIATSFTTSVNQMYFTYGLIAGLGYCLTFLPTVTILSQYFDRRRSLVVAVSSIGESLSIFALAPAFSALKENIGWRHTLAVMGAMQGSIIICGVLLRPIIINPKMTLEKETDRLSLKELEALGMQDNTKDSKPNNTSDAHDTFHSLDNELTRTSLSNGDSGVHSLKDMGNGKPQETTLLLQDVSLKTKGASVEDVVAEIGASGTEEKKRVDAEEPAPMEKNEPGGGGKPKAESFKLLDFSVLREPSFILYSMFGLFATLGFFAPPLYIIELSVSRGVERDRAAYMLSTMAVAEICGRFAIGWVLMRDALRSRKLLVLLACVLAMMADLVGFTLVTEFYGLAVCCAVYGFFMGTLSCTHIPMLAEDDVVGIERMASAAGVYVFIQSFAGLAGPPLGGVLVDVTQNYGSAFYSCAAGMAISAVFLGLVRPAKRGLLCWRKSSEPAEDAHQSKGDSEELSAA